MRPQLHAYMIQVQIHGNKSNHTTLLIMAMTNKRMLSLVPTVQNTMTKEAITISALEIRYNYPLDPKKLHSYSISIRWK